MQAQTNYNEADFSSRPVWIEMMNDSTVNYNQAVKAFNLYWKERIKPGEEEERMNEEKKQSREKELEHRRFEKELRKMNAAERNEFDRVNYQYKRFVNWMREMRPFVQPDGRILTAQQRMDIWKQQLAESKRQKITGN